MPNPVARESDEEKGEAGDQGQLRSGAKKEEAKPAPAARAVPARHRRTSSSASSICRFRPATSAAFRWATTGQVYYLKTADGKTSLRRFDLTKRRTRIDPAEPTPTASRATAKSCSTVPERTGPSSRRPKKVEASEGRIAVDSSRSRSIRGRVAADLRRSLADQSRLLLRPQHARGRLAGDARKVLAAAGARRDPRRSQPRHPVDDERARGRPPQRRRRRQPDDAEDAWRAGC